jgi:nucleoside-diphosphate-sugar epimerase
MLNILVAGGGGFVGSHLVDALLAAGHHVTVVDSFVTGRQSNLADADRSDRFQLIEADVAVPGFALKEHARFDRVYHLASPASPKAFDAMPVEILMVNSVGTRNLLEIARRDRARFLITSTSEVYGEPLVHPQTEDYRGNVNPIGPRSCYDEGKRFAESLTMAYHTHLGVDVRIARLFNTYGPRVSPNDGRIVPNFILQALSGEPLTVYGDGLQTRSFCYVEDTVQGLVALMESDRAAGEVVNLGNPNEHTVLQIAEQILELTGSDSEIAYLPLPVDDPSKRKPEIAKARHLLGWEPRTALHDGIEHTRLHFIEELGLDIGAKRDVAGAVDGGN